MKRLLTLAILLLVSLSVYGQSNSLAFGINGDNSGGCDIPDVYLEYEHDSGEGVEAHGRVHNKGNRVCADTLSADIGVESDHGFISVELGYDRRGVTALVGNDFYYGSAKSETANVNADFDFANSNVEVGIDLVKQVPRLAVESALPLGFEIEADVTFYDAGEFTTARLAWTKEFTAQWAVKAFVQTTLGADNVPDGIQWSDETGAPPGGPDAPHAYGFGVERLF